MVTSSQIPNDRIIKWNSIRKASPGVSESSYGSSSSNRLRSACDSCRQSRIKCSGGATCQQCKKNGLKCAYGVSMRHGRVKANGTGRNSKSSVTTGSHPADPVEEPEEVATQTRTFGSSDLQAFMNDEDFFMGYEFTNVPNTSSTLKDFAFDSSTSHSNSFPDGTISTDIGPIVSTPDLQSQPIFMDVLHSSSNSPPSFDPSTVFGLASKTRCRCLSTQFLCLSELCDLDSPRNIPLDAILQIAREKSKIVSEYLRCKECTKTSTNFIFPAIIFQRVGMLLCNVARHGFHYCQSNKLRVGSFELSAEEDVIHKKILVANAFQTVDAVLSELRATAADYQRQMGDSIITSGKSNLRWIFDATRDSKARVALMSSLLDVPDWGCNVCDDDDYHCRPT